MKQQPFKKSLLAMIVGAISTQVLAVEVDIGQGKSTWVGETLNESLTLTGKLTQPTNQTANQETSNWTGVGISDTRIQGALISRADIVLDAQGRFIRAFAVDPIVLMGTSSGSSTITGDVIQAGKIIMSNGAYEGLEIGAATIGGSVINSGTIQSTPPVLGAPTSGRLSGGDGIYLHGTTVAGDVSNTGVITMVGDDAFGLALDRRGTQQTSIGGKILNPWTIGDVLNVNAVNIVGQAGFTGIGLDPAMYGTHIMRRTKASLIYRRTKNLRAVQLLFGHTKLESTVRYLGIEVDDALEMAEQTEV